VLEQPAAEPYPTTLEVLLKSGAILQRRHGRLVAAHYGSVATEMAICLKAAGLALRPDLEAFELTGEPVALAELLASSLDALPPAPGEARDVGGVWVGRLGAAHAIVIGVPLALERMTRMLDRAAVPGVERGARDEAAAISLVGPRALDLLGVAGLVPAGERPTVNRARFVESDVVVLSHGRGWFTVVAPAASAELLWAALLSAGRSFGAVPVGCDAIDRLAASHRFSTAL
jgi:hypothetical protein